MSTSLASSEITVVAGHYPPQDVLHFQCYANNATVKHEYLHHDGSSSSASSFHKDCCTAILHAISHIWSTKEEEDFEGLRLFDQVSVRESEQMLLDLVISISSTSPPHHLDSASTLLGMLTLSPDRYGKTVVAAERESLDREQARTRTTSSLWVFFLWNDATQSGRWIITNNNYGKQQQQQQRASELFSPALDYVWVPTTTANDNKRIAMDDKEEPNHHSGDPTVLHLTSTLSKSGGMHRELRQKLNFSLPSDLALADRSNFDFSIFILLHVPSGLFINVEDAFSTAMPGLEIEISSISSSGSSSSNKPTTASDNGADAKSSTVIIDQEEPAFVSPSHAVVCHLTGSLDINKQPNGAAATTSSFIELTWDTHLHVRYPLPIQSDISASHYDYHYSQIAFMPPMIVSGEVVENRRSDESRRFYVLASSLLGKNATSSSDFPFLCMPQPAYDQAPLTLWVAAGQQDDFGPVFALTLLAALLGTIVSLRDVMLLYNKRDDAASKSSSTTKKDQ